MENKYQYIELEELIGHPPKLYIRIGGVFFLFIIGVLVLLSAIISIPYQEQIPVKIGVRDEGGVVIIPKNSEISYSTKNTMLIKGDTIAIFTRKDKVDQIILSPYNCNIYQMKKKNSDTLMYYVPTQYKYFFKAEVGVALSKNFLQSSFFSIDIDKNLYSGISDIVFRPEIGGDKVLIEALFSDSINRDINKNHPLIQNLQGKLIIYGKERSILKTILGTNI